MTLWFPSGSTKCVNIFTSHCIGFTACSFTVWFTLMTIIIFVFSNSVLLSVAPFTLPVQVYCANTLPRCHCCSGEVVSTQFLCIRPRVASGVRGQRSVKFRWHSGVVFSLRFTYVETEHDLDLSRVVCTVYKMLMITVTFRSFEQHVLVIRHNTTQ